ncbi:BolA/IbaG family iron-sulfur metabolism protein [Parvibaculum sedimenti]|uniref:BolA/IbaG family iron-sulfur metabolism protein n=2 Tax=Parvibaculum sedimenti TaxID=2608632 RepID=A0A6N6VFQ6_9HYPH|nr:BolA/IbaG family iron-sulfur metabolism protein [Parvibaculum sedimenti]
MSLTRCCVSVAEKIREKLEKAFEPLLLEIVDDSARHKGHAGHQSGGETHFNVTIVSAAFNGCTRVERHRLVTAALREEIGNPIHALALKTLTPDEAR